jgi:hypothetical protein
MTKRPMPYNYVPPELVDQILGELGCSEEYEGKSSSSLSNCALVCKDWTGVAQRRIFSYVVLKPANDRKGMDRLSRFEAGIHLFQSNPSLCHLVQNVTINLELKDYDAKDTSELPYDTISNLLLNRSFTTLAFFPYIQNLELQAVRFSQPSRNFQPSFTLSNETHSLIVQSLQSVLSTVKVLKLHRISLAAVDDLQNLLFAARDLHTLHYSMQIHWGDDRYGRREPIFSSLSSYGPPRLCCISGLDLQFQSVCEPIVKLFLSEPEKQPPQLALRDMVLIWDDKFGIGHGNESEILTRRFAEKLEHLEVMVSRPTQEAFPSEF